MILLPAETPAGSKIMQTVLAGCHFFVDGSLGRKQEISENLRKPNTKDSLSRKRKLVD